MAKLQWVSPKDCLSNYRSGFQGSRCDDEDVERLLGELPHPVFGVTARDLAGTGENKVSLPFRSVLNFDIDAYMEVQSTGDCVSHAVRNACDLSRAVEIHLGEPEGWVARGATEAIYGCRGHGGQGMSCSQAARFVNSTGGLLLRKDYGDVDLTTYNSSLGTHWGRKLVGVPSDLVSEAKKHQVVTVSYITTLEEARDALANGYGVSCCSGYGFASKRDFEGFANQRGKWAHAMMWSAVDDKYRRPGFLVQNSWGKWNSGPKRHWQPDGSFWIDFDVAEKMIKQRGTWAFSNVDGFPPRKLPDYGAGDYL
jgi:hypothetical protein